MQPTPSSSPAALLWCPHLRPTALRRRRKTNTQPNRPSPLSKMASQSLLEHAFVSEYTSDTSSSPKSSLRSDQDPHEADYCWDVSAASPDSSHSRQTLANANNCTADMSLVTTILMTRDHTGIGPRGPRSRSTSRRSARSQEEGDLIIAGLKEGLAQARRLEADALKREADALKREADLRADALKREADALKREADLRADAAKWALELSEAKGREQEAKREAAMWRERCQVAEAAVCKPPPS